MDGARIAIVGDYNAEYTGHRDTCDALVTGGRRLGLAVSYEWLATDRVAAVGVSVLEGFDGIWAAPGSPYRSLDGALAAIRYARERDRPFIGT
jgi:CTP synthase (UTP-ammonia lyase)